MKKTKVFELILNLIFPVVFNLCLFLIGGTQHPLSVWISYGFIHGAYIMNLLTPSLTRKGKSAAIFGLSIAAISWVYFGIEFIVGAVCMLIAAKNYVGTLITQVIIFGIYAAVLLKTLIANEHTADAEEARQVGIDFVKNASTDVKAIMARVTDKQTARKLEKLYDEVNSSPIKTTPALASVECSIIQGIRDMQDRFVLLDEQEIQKRATQLLLQVQERNSRLKLRN